MSQRNPSLATDAEVSAVAAANATTLEVGTVTSTTVGITSDGSVDDVILPEATATEAGLLNAADKVKLNATSGTNTGDMTDADVKTAYENNADTNAFTDAEKTKVSNLSGTNTGDQVIPVDSVNTQTGVVVLDADDISDAATTNKFVTASDLTTLGSTSGTNTGDETTGTIQTKRPLKTVGGTSLEGAGDVPFPAGEVQSTETVAGIAEIATQPEVHAGTDDVRFITPLKLASEKGIANGLVPLNASSQIDPSYLSGGGKSMVMALAAGTSYYVEAGGNSYAKRAAFVYAGTISVGDIMDIKLNAWRTGGSTADFRIYDVTNALVIAELTGVTSTSETNLADMGTISNLPTGAAIFELQIRRGDPGATGYCGSIELTY